MSSSRETRLYQNIMRRAETRMRAAARRELAKNRGKLGAYGAKLKNLRYRNEVEAQCTLEAIDAEIAAISRRRERTSNMLKRVELKAAIVHLRELRASILGKDDRKPPESGIPAPAIPPSGPLPKQGGAAAPLEFD